MTKISLYGISHDPFEDEDLALEESSSDPYLLIKSREPWGPAHWRELASVGVTCLERVGTDVYLYAGGDADLPTVKSLRFVIDARPYSREFKLDGSLMPTRSMSPGLGMVATEPDPVSVDLVLHEGVDASRFAELLSAGYEIEDLEVGRGKLRFTASAETAAQVSELNGVRRVEPAAEYEHCSNVACNLVHASEVHRDIGLTGEGETVVVCDSGLDIGRVGNVHPAFKGRVVKLIPIGRQQHTNDPTGHGTHVAGLAVGNGTSTEIKPPGAITGTAPGAGLIVQSIFKGGNPAGGVPFRLQELFESIYTDFGARIHNNSWVEKKVGGFYSPHCRELDEFVHFHRDLVVVCATGNRGKPGAGPGTLRDQTVRPPATAKNCISVGACESLREDLNVNWGDQTVPGMSGRFDGDPVISIDGWSDDKDQVAPFSGRGPTRNGRIKPDLVAPGTVILGPASRAVQNPSNDWGSSVDEQYRYLGGTSMAAPIVAGCAAVVRQHLGAQLGRSPSASLVKAALINAADDLAGVPNYSEGWGRVNLARAVMPDLPDRVEYHDEGTMLTTGRTDTHEMQCLEAGLPLKVTLVWTDPPGEELQSHLDLIVEIDGTDSRSANQALIDSGFDHRNNVQQIVWDNFQAGAFRIRVHANETLPSGQTFAVVVRGGI